jgi:hypothetical protein
MELYQRFVLGIAIVLLIGAYVMIFFTLVNNKTNWPPSMSKCPDFWIFDLINNKCDSNGFNRGKNNVSIFPENDINLSDKTKCEKYKWAVENEISWDGLTYGTSLNCPLTTL